MERTENQARIDRQTHIITYLLGLGYGPLTRVVDIPIGHIKAAAAYADREMRSRLTVIDGNGNGETK